MPTEDDFGRRGWQEVSRYGRFVVFEDPSGQRPLARLNLVSWVAKRHRNEDLRQLELMAVLRGIVRATVAAGLERDALLNQVNGLAGESSETVDPG